MRQFGRFGQNGRIKTHQTDAVRSFPRVKWSKRESTHCPPCRLQPNVNRLRSFAPTPPYVVVVVS